MCQWSVAIGEGMFDTIGDDVYFRDFDLSRLKIDEAYLSVNSSLSSPWWLYAKSDDCYKVNK